MAFGRKGAVALLLALASFAASCRCDLGTPVMVGRQHAVVARQVDARARYQSGEARDKVDGFEHDLRGAVAIRSLERVDTMSINE